MNEFAGDVKKAATAFQTFNAAANNAESAVGVLNGGMGALKATMGALGIAVVVAGIADLVSYLEQQRKEAEDAEKATTGLADACKVAYAAAYDYGDALDESAAKAESYRETSTNLRQDLANLADEFTELNQNTSAGLFQLDNAWSAIDNLGGKSGLTAQEVGQLKSAVDTLNTSCGTNYEVIRQADGTYQVMQDGVAAAKDEIYNLIEAQKVEMQVAGQQEKLEKLYEKLPDASKAYTDALDKQAEAQRNYNDAYNAWVEHGKPQESYNSYKNALDGATAVLDHWDQQVEESRSTLDGLNSNISNVETTIGNLVETSGKSIESFDDLVRASSLVQDAFDNDQDVLTDFGKALENSGASLDNFKNMSEGDLVTIANMWAESGESISSICSQLGIDVMGMSDDVKTALTSMADGQIAEALESSGVNLDQLSVAMSNAGISAETLNQIGSENFAALAANCGGSIDTLLFMLQNYNGTPIYDKNGNITANTAQLIDAQGRIYTWNGSSLVTQHGEAVVQYDSLRLANGETIEWNSQGLPTKNGKVLVQDEPLQLANGRFVTWNGTNLKTQDGYVIVDQIQLTDCLGNMVTYNGTTLKKIEGNVYCDYSELTSALSSISALERKDGYTATVYLNTVKTTRTRTVNEGTSNVPKDASTMSLSPMRARVASVQAAPTTLAAMSPVARASATDMADHAVTSVVDEARQSVTNNTTNYEYNLWIDSRRVESDSNLEGALRQLVDAAVRTSKGGPR